MPPVLAAAPHFMAARPVIRYRREIFPYSQAVIECDNKFRERILFRLASLGDGADITQDSELAVAAAQLRLAGRLVFDLHDKRSLVCCSGCDSFDIKDSRSNVSTQCHTCKYNVYNTKRHTKRQKDNKEERMDAQNRTPFSALSDDKWKRRLLVFNRDKRSRVGNCSVLIPSGVWKQGKILVLQNQIGFCLGWIIL